MKSPLLKTVKKSIPKEGIRLNRRAVTFLICLTVSTFLWIVQTLSQHYKVNIDFPVSYVNLPTDKVVTTPLPPTIKIVVYTSGFNYLMNKFNYKKKELIVDMKHLKRLHKNNLYFVLPNSKIETISSQFNENIKVLKVVPDTIFLNFNKKISKQVPIKSNIRIYFDDNYQATDSLILQPKMVTVSGAKEQVEKIKYVETKLVVLKKVKKSVSIPVDINQSPDLKLMELSTNSVVASVSVTKYTEANIELPIEFKNVPKGYSIKTFPDKVSVRYKVALENYKNIKPSDFIVIVNYSKYSKESNKLKVELIKFPAKISMPKINPEKVEFIIRK